VKNGLISLNISAEGCGAYCTSWTDYFTYNETGQYITIDQIIDITGGFKNRVMADKAKQYQQQKQELKEMLHAKNTELDKNTYNWSLAQFENCENEFTVHSFALYSDRIEIIDNCDFPHAIKNLTPTTVLKYHFVDIEKDLKIKY
jgi:hypothetical protein